MGAGLEDYKAVRVGDAAVVVDMESDGGGVLVAESLGVGVMEFQFPASSGIGALQRRLLANA